jgi:hypothetical protein
MVYNLLMVRWPNLTLAAEVAAKSAESCRGQGALQEIKKGRNRKIAALRSLR